MAEKILYSVEEFQSIFKNAIQVTSKGIFEFINNENLIVDKFYKSEILNAILEACRF